MVIVIPSISIPQADLGVTNNISFILPILRPCPGTLYDSGRQDAATKQEFPFANAPGSVIKYPGTRFSRRLDSNAAL